METSAGSTGRSVVRWQAEPIASPEAAAANAPLRVIGDMPFTASLKKNVVAAQGGFGEHGQSRLLKRSGMCVELLRCGSTAMRGKGQLQPTGGFSRACSSQMPFR